MNLGESIWDRLTRLVLGLVVVAVMLGIAVWYQPVINANRGMRARKLEFDASTETFVNDPEANHLLKRVYRDPWVVPEKV